MSNQREKETTTSWADEPEDLEEPIIKPKDSNAWAKGNPWGTVPKTYAEPKDSNLNDFPEPKGFHEKEPKRDEARQAPYGKITQKEINDYSPKDTYRREEKPFGNFKEERSQGRDYPREDRDRGYRREREEKDYPREEKDYPREEKPFKEYSRREETDRRGYRSERPERTHRDPVPYPTQPPFTAFVGNLSFDVREEDVYEFFGTKSKVNNVRLLSNRETNRPKGFGYVEFEDLESLKIAVGRSGEPLLDRPLKIDVAEAKPEEKGGTWGNRPSRPHKPFGSSYPSNSTFERGEREVPDEPRERRKLDLKPRTENNTKETNAPDNAYQAAKFNPFGEAKPRDENLYLKKIEEGRKKRGDEEKERSSPGLLAEGQISEESVDYGAASSREPSDTKGVPQLRDRDSQKKDDKFRNKVDKGAEKPFVRGSKSQDRGFKKEDRRGDRTRKERDEKKEDRPPRADKPPREQETVKIKQLDVTSTNLFSALTEDEE